MKSEGLPQNSICQTRMRRIHKEYASWASYVVKKDVKNNVVFVSRNYCSLDKRRLLFRVGSLKWLSGQPPSWKSHLQCKLEVDGDGQDVAVVHLSEDDQGLAAGQFTAFYEGKTCIKFQDDQDVAVVHLTIKMLSLTIPKYSIKFHYKLRNYKFM